VLAPSTTQKAATQRPVVQSPQQHYGGAPGKHAAQVEPDPSSSVPIPTLSSHLLILVFNLLGPAGQDARSTKLPVSPGLPGSLYIESPPCKSRSGDHTGHLAPGTLPPFTMLDSNFPAMEGESLAPRDSELPQVRTKTWAQHVAAASLASRISSIKYVVDSTLQYTTPNILLQVQDPLPPPPASWPAYPQESTIPALPNPAVNPQIDNQSSAPPVDDFKSCRSVNNPYVNPPVR
jgi:hypothetical protein